MSETICASPNCRRRCLPVTRTGIDGTDVTYQLCLHCDRIRCGACGEYEATGWKTVCQTCGRPFKRLG